MNYDFKYSGVDRLSENKTVFSLGKVISGLPPGGACALWSNIGKCHLMHKYKMHN